MKALILVFAIAAASPSWADQCELLTEKQATAALKVLTKGTQYVVFCEPCGDQSVPALRTIETATFDATQGSLAVNGEAVDLAYLFIGPEGAKTPLKNVAALAKCPTVSVSKTVPRPKRK